MQEPVRLGAYFDNDTANFALFSSHATAVILGLFKGNEIKEIPLQRSGDIWHVSIPGLPSEIQYAYRCEGPYDEKKGLLFKKDQWLIDPYAKKVINGRAVLEKEKTFDWQGIQQPQIPLEELVIYEMHVRGFTLHSSSQVMHPGTYLGLLEKIPYLKELGVNAIELMPIFDFNQAATKLTNYWGYNPFHYFVPMHMYGNLEELKTLVRELHRNQIQIFLDVVYSHTGEGNNKNFAISFRGIDNSAYYLLNQEGEFLDFSGCGNTLHCNHPAVQKLILDSLQYWIEEVHIDGFRFDLASIFSLDSKGEVLSQPPLIQAISQLKDVKLIAEPWDMGLNQQGYFAKWGPWLEWSQTFRDTSRNFIKGTGQASSFANVFTGNKAEFQKAQSSINYITCHDGFSLRDLVSYNQKHNEDNGEQNRDGQTLNNSWNCGAEGPVSDEKINAFRERQMRNFFLTLFLSQGTPMMLMGDEYGHTHKGNNNPYLQDNELNWFLWDELEKNKDIFHFVSSLIAFRKKYLHPDQNIQWHDTTFILQNLLIAFNPSAQNLKVQLPSTHQWRLVVNTEASWSQNHLSDPSKGPVFPTEIELIPYSTLLAIKSS